MTKWFWPSLARATRCGYCAEAIDYRLETGTLLHHFGSVRFHKSCQKLAQAAFEEELVRIRGGRGGK